MYIVLYVILHHVPAIYIVLASSKQGNNTLVRETIV